MVAINKKDINLYLSIFFMSTSIINTVYQYYIGDYKELLILLSMNTVLSVVFLAMYKMQRIKIEVEISILLLICIVIKLTSEYVDMTEMSLLITYTMMLIVKQTKIKPIMLIVLIFGVFTIGVVSMILSHGNIALLSKQVLLVCVMSFIHYSIYYKDFKTKIDLKTKYNLEEWHIETIDLIVKDNPTVSEMTEELNQSISTVNSYLKTIYDKMGIPEGGNRKAGLILKLAQLGYISH